MKKIKILLSFLGFLFVASPAITKASEASEVSSVVVTFGVAAIAVVLTVVGSKKSQVSQVAGVEVEVWVNYLISRFWKDNAFLTKVFRDDQYVLAGKVVHIPQIGAAPEIVKNRNVFPAIAVGRTDSDVTYALDVYTSTPTHIQEAEKHEVSYDKINSVLGDHAGAINQTVADDLIIKWLTGISAGSKMLTTGAAVGATAPSATGNRKLFLPADLRKAMTKFNADNVPLSDRYVMPSANMLDHLIQSLSDTQYKDFSSYMDAKTGIIGKLFGFTFLDRSATAVADNTNVVKALGAAGATTDNEVTLIWQKDSLAAALGDVKFFDNVNDPQYYGDIYSALLRAGGRRRRSDDKGIIMLAQDVAA